jgi:hypothetical protein
MSKSELDRIRAQIESEPVLVANGVGVTLAGLREVLERARQRRLQRRDFSVLAAVISEVIAEAGDREIVTITVDDQDVRSGLSAAETSAAECAEGPSPSDEVGRG